MMPEGAGKFWTTKLLRGTKETQRPQGNLRHPLRHFGFLAFFASNIFFAGKTGRREDFPLCLLRVPRGPNKSNHKSLATSTAHEEIYTLKTSFAPTLRSSRALRFKLVRYRQFSYQQYDIWFYNKPYPYK